MEIIKEAREVKLTNKMLIKQKIDKMMSLEMDLVMLRGEVRKMCENEDDDLIDIVLRVMRSIYIKDPEYDAFVDITRPQ